MQHSTITRETLFEASRLRWSIKLRLSVVFYFARTLPPFDSLFVGAFLSQWSGTTLKLYESTSIRETLEVTLDYIRRKRHNFFKWLRVKDTIEEGS